MRAWTELVVCYRYSNFGVSHLKALKEAGLEMPEVNQVELHCWHQQKLLVKYHATESIATMGYCPSACSALRRLSRIL